MRSRLVTFFIVANELPQQIRLDCGALAKLVCRLAELDRAHSKVRPTTLVQLLDVVRLETRSSRTLLRGKMLEGTEKLLGFQDRTLCKSAIR